MQVYLRAADIAVLPYQRCLNSGVLALTQTFGLPAVLPAHSRTGRRRGRHPHAGVRRGRPHRAPDALENASRLLTPQARAAATAAGQAIAAPVVARRFAGAMRSWLDGARA